MSTSLESRWKRPSAALEVPAVDAPPDGDSYEYDAFISYRRKDGAALARWIRDRLQRCELPRDGERVDVAVEGIGDAADMPADAERVRVEIQGQRIAHLIDTGGRGGTRPNDAGGGV